MCLPASYSIPGLCPLSFILSCLGPEVRSGGFIPWKEVLASATRLLSRQEG